jgi:GPH family glycoside/pentoside/hexuronide:cation symporter
LSQPAPPTPRLSIGTILAFAAGGLSISGLGIAIPISLQPYFAQTLGVGLVPIALAFFWVRILDLGVDLGLAVVMDRTRTPIGRYRAWTLLGAPVLMAGVYQLFMAPKGIGVSYLIVWLLVYALGSSIVTLSRSAWSANLVTRYDQRSRFYGYLGLALVIGILIVLGTPIVSDSLGKGRHLPNSVQLMGWSVLALTPIGAILTAVVVREPITIDAAALHFALRESWAVATKPEVLRLFFSQFALTLGPGWMANLYLFFFMAKLGFTEGPAYGLLIAYVLAGVAGAPLIGYLGGRFGKHRTLILSTLCYSAGLCSVVVLPRESWWLTLPVMIWCGLTGNGFDLMTSAMMADVGDQVRLEQGKERMALLFAVIGLAQKLAAAGAVIISYPLLDAIGYKPALLGHNTPAALNGLQIVFILGPIFWVVLGGLCFLGWKLDARRHAEIRGELEARDARLVAGRALDSGIA